MSKDTAELICIIDRSGSMHSIRDDAIGGFNAFLKEQKALPGDARLTLVLFDDQYEVVFDGAPLREVLDLTEETYVPRGSTALLDAVGRALSAASARLSGIPEDGRPEKVIVCILTDGMENASREFTREQIFDMISARKTNGWEFVFLAASQEAIQEGAAMGIDALDRMLFQSTSAGISDAYLRLSGTVRERRERSQR